MTTGRVTGTTAALKVPMEGLACRPDLIIVRAPSRESFFSLLC